MDLLNETAQVWVPEHPTMGWCPCRVDGVDDDGNYIAVDDEGGQFTLAPVPFLSSVSTSTLEHDLTTRCYTVGARTREICGNPSSRGILPQLQYVDEESDSITSIR